MSDTRRPTLLYNDFRPDKQRLFPTHTSITAVKRVFEATRVRVFGGRRTEFMRII
jgi:hypothetical protein